MPISGVHGTPADGSKERKTESRVESLHALHYKVSMPVRRIVVHFALSMAVSFLLLFVGFRLFYDSVIPEVFGLVLAGFCLAIARPRLWWGSVLGLCAGVALSELVFPATPPPAHVAQYG